MTNVHRLFDDPAPVAATVGDYFRSRRANSASMASRMNTAMRLGPTRASMRRLWSSVRRTFVSFTFSGGRPMRGGVSGPEIFVKVIEKASPLIDRLSVPGYISGDGYKINGDDKMTKRIVKLVCKAFGLRVPTKYLPGRVVTFTDAGVVSLRAAYGQSTEGQW